MCCQGFHVCCSKHWSSVTAVIFTHAQVLIETENVYILAGKYGEASMGGYTQSPGGFGSPAASQGGEKKGVSVPQLYNLSITCLGYVNIPTYDI